MMLHGTDSKGNQWEAEIDSEVRAVEIATFTDPLPTIEETVVYHVKVIRRVGEFKYAAERDNDPAKVLEVLFDEIKRLVG